MNFRQILSKHNPVDSKNKLNKLLAEVERNFGVFSRDMELDIRTSISSPVVLDYFDRIIHEEHTVLEHDQVDISPKSQNNNFSKTKKEAKKKAKRNPLSPITMDRDDYGKSPVPYQPVRLSKTNKIYVVN